MQWAMKYMSLYWTYGCCRTSIIGIQTLELTDIIEQIVHLIEHRNIYELAPYKHTGTLKLPKCDPY